MPRWTHRARSLGFALILLATPLVVVTANATLAEALTATTTKLTASATSTGWGATVTFTATVHPTPASGSVHFTDILSSGPESGQTVTLGTVPIATSTATLTIALPAFNTNTVNAVFSGNSTLATSSSATGPGATTKVVPVSAYTSELIISQFRTSGPGGADDQYVEIYNTGLAVPLAGFRLKPSTGSTLTLPNSAPTLATGGSYLIAGSTYSLGGVAAADDSSGASLGSGGFQLVAPDVGATVVDAVGFVGAQPGYFSGTALPAMNGTPTAQYAWVRIEIDGVMDNDADNATDFKLVSTSGGLVGGVESTLGTPSPQATGSPVEDNNAGNYLSSDLLDTDQPSSAAPNFVYASGTGTLTIRRTLTNEGGSTITSAEVRMVSLSEANGLPEPDVGSQPTRAAVLTLADPATDTSVVSIPEGGTATVDNLSVAAPSTAGTGGGLATTLSIPLSGGLAAGDSVDVAFTFHVVSGGTYWFGYDIDDLGGSAPAVVAPGFVTGHEPQIGTAPVSRRATRSWLPPAASGGNGRIR